MTDDLTEINVCEVCGNTNLVTVLDLGNHPMCDDLVKTNESRVCKEYPIEILFCSKCVTGHQRFQVNKNELFPSSYHYRSRFTGDVLKGMEDLIQSLVQRYGSLKNKKILDIGCNDGSLLNFCKNLGGVTIGIEPTNACLDANENGHFTYNNFLTKNVAEELIREQGHPDFIFFTNVFAHIENLSGVIDSLKILKKKETIIVIENHYLGSVLERSQFDTFYHEHPRTYSFTSFLHIAKSLGVTLLDSEFPSRYGGNIRVFLGDDSIYKKGNEAYENLLIKKESDFLKKFKELKNKIEIWTLNKNTVIEKLIKKHGKIAAKAFPGRAAILVKMLDLNETKISCVYEKPGSLKIGNFLPGTRIPIRSDQDLSLVDSEEKPIINLAWHISKEITEYMISIGYKGQIIDILSEDDFSISE